MKLDKNRNTLRQQLNFIQLDWSANVVVEFAILIPVFILLVLAVIEFGYYFVRYEIVSRAVSTASQTIQRNPLDNSIEQLAQDAGTSLVPFGQSGNYICAQSYASMATAKSDLCSGDVWNTSTPPNVNANGIYWVAVAAYAPANLLTPIENIWHGANLLSIHQSVVVQIGGSSSKGFTHVEAATCTGGVWTVPDGITTVEFSMIGGGGSGGDSVGFSCAGGGGGSDTRIDGIYTNLNSGMSLPCSVGNGSKKQNGGFAQRCGDNSAPGGDTTFGILTAHGGGCAIPVNPTYNARSPGGQSGLYNIGSSSYLTSYVVSGSNGQDGITIGSSGFRMNLGGTGANGSVAVGNGEDASGGGATYSAYTNFMSIPGRGGNGAGAGGGGGAWGAGGDGSPGAIIVKY